MGFFQTKGGAAWLCGCILMGSPGDLADPERAHELEARESSKVVRVPFPERRVLRCLADNGVLHDRVAEVVNHGCDGEGATEPFIQTRLRHGSLLCVAPESVRPLSAVSLS